MANYVILYILIIYDNTRTHTNPHTRRLSWQTHSVCDWQRNIQGEDMKFSAFAW